jgi:hypothetical protein
MLANNRVLFQKAYGFLNLPKVWNLRKVFSSEQLQIGNVVAQSSLIDIQNNNIEYVGALLAVPF